MTMTETRPPANEKTNGKSDGVPALSDQVVMSTAGVASQGFTTLRRVADGTLATLDRTMLGAFDLAEKLAQSNLLAELATKSIAVARDSWSTGIASAREVLADL